MFLDHAWSPRSLPSLSLMQIFEDYRKVYDLEPHAPSLPSPP